MPADTLTRRQLNRATLARQMLLARERVAVTDAVGRLGGLQAQEPKPPFLGLWSRVDGFRREDLHDALRAYEVVRATLMRATLHLMSATDYGQLRMALQPALTAAMTGALRGRDAGLDLEKVLPVARELLAVQPRTFDELRGLLAEAFPKVDERALGYAVRTQLPLVMVPTGDRWAFPRNAAFALPEGRLAKAPSAGGDLEALALRYLAAFGPAAAADLQAWTGLKGMKAVLDGLRERLSVFRDERGRILYDLPDAPRPGDDAPAPARFLPEFDSLVLAHDDRTRVVADEHRGGLVTKNLRVRATFLWDGFAAGTWTAERKGATATLRLAPFAPLPKRALRELTEEGQALLRFAEADASRFAVEPG